MLDDFSGKAPTSFDFTYIHNGIKYNYGFSATRQGITEEHLYHWPKGQQALVFTRRKQEFQFVTTT